MKKNIDELTIKDYLKIIYNHKLLYLSIIISTMTLSYISIYLLIDERFDSKAVIIPSEQSMTGNLSSLLKNMNGLPFDIMGSSSTNDMDLYITILNSRSILEKIAKKFDLQKEYGLESKEKTINILKDNIKTNITDENAFEITVRSKTPKQAADMVNYILSLLNDTVVEFNIRKSKENRVFLEHRLSQVKNDLKYSEDSLQYFQENSGLYEVENQSKEIIEMYTDLEGKLMAKKLEYSILSNTNGSDSPQMVFLRSEISEFEKNLNSLKRDGLYNSTLLSLNKLPENAKEYLRLFRDVEINNKILEVLLPLYEQAKLEEMRNMPVLQVIDKPNIPERKSYPPRSLYALIITLNICILLYIRLFYMEYIKTSPARINL